MSKRFFSKRQKKILNLISGNFCEKCGVHLKGKFHADHKKAFSKGVPCRHSPVESLT